MRQQSKSKSSRDDIVLPYTSSIDYRTDLQIERERGADLQSEINRLKQHMYRQDLEIISLRHRSNDYESLKKSYGQLCSDMAEFNGMLRLKDEQLRDREANMDEMISWKTDKQLLQEQNNVLRQQVQSFKVRAEEHIKIRQNLEKEISSMEAQLAHTKKNNILVNAQLQELKNRMGNIDLIMDLDSEHRQLEQTQQFSMLLHKYAKQHREYRQENAMLVEKNQQLTKEIQIIRQTLKGLEMMRPTYEAKQKQFSELEDNYRRRISEMAQWKSKMTRDINEELMVQVDNIKGSYRNTVERKNHTIGTLLSLLQLKGVNCVDSNQRRILDEAQFETSRDT